MFCRHLDGARWRILQTKLPDGFEQSSALAILKECGTKTKQLAQSINHRSRLGDLAVGNPGIVPARQVSEANVAELIASVLCAQARQQPSMLHSYLILQPRE